MEYTDKIIVEQINKKLFNDFGRALDGRPIWRITWSSTEFELKRGAHETWSPSGNIFLNTWIGVKKCLKYGYVPDKWILERLTFLGTTKIGDFELVEAGKGTYEPVYVFQDNKFNPLPVNWRVCEVIFSQLLAGPGYTSPTEREEMKRKLEDLEVNEMEDYLNETGRSPLFAFENSVSLGSSGRKR